MPSSDYQKKVKQELHCFVPSSDYQKKVKQELHYNNIVQNVEIENFGLIFSLK